VCAALAAPLPSSADLLLAIAGIIELPGATPVAATISETDADASKCAAAERATEAIGVQNIRGLIPIVLDFSADNYSCWSESFLLTLGKFSLQDHVLYDGSAPAIPDWICMDCVVSSWIHGSVSIDIADALDRGCTACAA